MKQIRAVLIDPFSCTCTEHYIDDTLNAIYTLGNYSCFTTIRLPNGDILMVDDEGLFEGRHLDPDDMKRGFAILRPNFQLGSLFIGRGVILGVDEEGVSKAAKTQIDEFSIVYLKTSAHL